MNMYDSEVAQGLLRDAGFDTSSTYEGDGPRNPRSVPDADVVLMNTCSVREHAEERVFGRLGMLGKAKRKNPDLILGLMGCMVEEHKDKLFKRFPQLDLMVGTRNIKELPSLIEEVRQTRRQVSKIKQDGISIEYTELIQRQGTFHAWLPIMTGCNKVCTFCIVPITRGSEVSMPAREVYREASRLVSEGVKCITLLGQNVNSYNGSPHPTPLPRGEGEKNRAFREGEGGLNSLSLQKGEGGKVEAGFSQKISISPAGRGQGEGGIHFPELLEMLCGIEGLERIAFTTSHPQDATEELFRVIARNPKVSRRFHLPLQSGSDRILKRMKRLHTYDEYKAKIEAMRALIPGVSVTTDIIAGFSGETEEDHQATIRALEEIRYAGAYIYKYSLRPATPASKLPDDVPLTIKDARNRELLEIQARITREINETLIGQTVEVFVEEQNRSNSAEMVGRTSADKKVVFPASKDLLGRLQKVKLETLRRETFFGMPIV